MRKTNLRINNVFIIEDNGKHYMSNIDDPDEWSNLESSELKEGKDITKTLKELMDEYGISSNVNFFGFNQKGGADCDKELEGGDDDDDDGFEGGSDDDFEDDEDDGNFGGGSDDDDDDEDDEDDFGGGSDDEVLHGGS